MGQKCSSGYVKVDGDNYGNRGQGGGDPRFGNHTSNINGNSMGGSNRCVAMPMDSPNRSQFQGNPSTGLTSTNVFDTTANRLGFISPIHT
mgnify:FL=1|tara:strand:- start:257 stop:526 length:270 start_codon:yes stop_codon:yes gene_type:complete